MNREPVGDAKAEEITQRHTVGLLNGGCPAGQGDIFQVPHSLKSAPVGYQEFPAPDSAVGAVSGAIECHPDDRPGGTVLHQTAYDMGMVMLNRNQLQIGFPLDQFEGVLRGQVVWVHIVGYHLGMDAKQPLVKLDGVLELLQSLLILHIADVLAHESMVLPGETEGVLFLGAAGKDLPGLKGQEDGIGGIAPCSAHRYAVGSWQLAVPLTPDP
ncbi:MAG: hypothetical protein DDT30_01930 [Dehalococcoidia bacterium]|nr:hypothetical protein [Bacillota bacterium]